MNKFVYILLLPLITHAQDFISTNTFESKTSKGTVVIEFWAEWNKGNQVDFLPTLKDCDVYRVDIVKQSSIQKNLALLLYLQLLYLITVLKNRDLSLTLCYS